MRVMNLTFARLHYGAIHLATSSQAYATIACGTPCANVCTEDWKEVTCGRCKKTGWYISKETRR